MKIIEEKGNHLTYLHVIESIDLKERCLVLADGSNWKIGYWYQDDIKNWAKGQRLKISQHSKAYSNDVRFVNIDEGHIAWGEIQKRPKQSDWLVRVSQGSLDTVPGGTVILNSGAIFKGRGCTWKVRDPIFVFHNNDDKEGICDLWNLRTQELIEGWRLVGDETKGSAESILNLASSLKKRVLGQEEVIDQVSNAMLRCWTGLQDPKVPVGVFLFLGPSGCGKTELAKILNFHLFPYQSMTRFDMSHFGEFHSLSRLIGSPPGYVNHEEGGQLTEALRGNPRSLVLLDEIEKAHPSVRKFFLPVFDEGIIKDAKNRLIPCNKALFILTSNLCSKEIVSLFSKGYSPEEVKEFIEPALLAELSPELYNRVTPLIFRPITLDLMGNLVDLMLQEVSERLVKIKKMKVFFGEGVKEYLIEHGFHPQLGARPLKRLIQEKVVGLLSLAILQEGIPEGSSLHIIYKNNQFILTWS